MKRLNTVAILAGIACGLAPGCELGLGLDGGQGSTWSATLDVTTTTTGSDVDPNGYRVAWKPCGPEEGTCWHAHRTFGIGINDRTTSGGTFFTVCFGASGGGCRYAVDLWDVAENCTVAGTTPRYLGIDDGKEASLSFEITCGDR